MVVIEDVLNTVEGKISFLYLIVLNNNIIDRELFMNEIIKAKLLISKMRKQLCINITFCECP